MGVEGDRKPLKMGECLFFAHFTASPGLDLRLVFKARRVGDGMGSGGTQHAGICGIREGRDKGIIRRRFQKASKDRQGVGH